MGYFFKTANSIYVVTKGTTNETCFIEGGQFQNKAEIYLPLAEIEEFFRDGFFVATLTNNPMNGISRGVTFRTSRIMYFAKFDERRF